MFLSFETFGNPYSKQNPTNQIFFQNEKINFDKGAANTPTECYTFNLFLSFLKTNTKGKPDTACEHKRQTGHCTMSSQIQMSKRVKLDYKSGLDSSIRVLDKLLVALRAMVVSAACTTDRTEMHPWADKFLINPSEKNYYKAMEELKRKIKILLERFKMYHPSYFHYQEEVLRGGVSFLGIEADIDGEIIKFNAYKLRRVPKLEEWTNHLELLKSRLAALPEVEIYKTVYEIE